jgi:hypothetical protein
MHMFQRRISRLSAVTENQARKSHRVEKSTIIGKWANGRMESEKVATPDNGPDDNGQLDAVSLGYAIRVGQ